MRSGRFSEGDDRAACPWPTISIAAVRRPPYVRRASVYSVAPASARVGGGKVRLRYCRRPNGLEVNPRGQGPRGYGSAARGVPAFDARDASGVTSFKYRLTSRLGRRAEAGPRRVLPRVRPRFGGSRSYIF